jgi:type I restriction enzyme S subunit
MSSEWKETTLGEICKSQGGAIQTGPFGSQLHTSDYKEFGIPVVMPTNINDGGIFEDGIARIEAVDVERLSQHKLRLGDIIFSRRGDVTKNALIRSREIGWLCGTGCLKVRLGTESLATAKFISNCLRHPDTKDWLVRHAVGATMPNLNTGILSNVPVKLPPLQTQQEIALILDTLDDRITLLRETNATLEAIAQALFKSWFVDFDPVHAKMQGTQPEGMDEQTAALFPDSFEESELGLVPVGWKVARFEEFITRIPVGKKYDQKTALLTGEIPILDQGKSGIIGYHNDCAGVNSSLEEPVVVFANHTCYMRLITFPFSAIQNVLPFKGRNVETVWAYYATKDRVTFSEYKGHYPEFAIEKAILPSKELTTIFKTTIFPLLERTRLNEVQLKTLADLRDTLLPRLISGQLRVGDVEEIAA